MPPKINVANRPVVEDSFKEALTTFWKKRWKAMNELILTADHFSRSMVILDNAPSMNRLKALCTDKKLLDIEYAKLYTLPYIKFFTKEYDGRIWLMGLTRPIVLTDGLKQWQGPSYYVCIPNDVDEREHKKAFHFLPKGKENTRWRHPHHKASNIHLGEWNTQPDTLSGNPLGADSSTCWGSFGAFVTTCIETGDLVDLYRTLHIYLTRIDENSLLIRPWNRANLYTEMDDLEIPDRVLQPAAYARWEAQQQKLERKKRR